MNSSQSVLYIFRRSKIERNVKVGERQFTESDVENELFTKFLSSKLLQYPLISLQNFFSHPVYAEHKLKKKKSSIFRIPQLIRKRMDNISLAAKNKITILPFIRSFPFSE